MVREEFLGERDVGELLGEPDDRLREVESNLQRLKELEAENAKLKRMYAELALENAAIKDVLSRKR